MHSIAPVRPHGTYKQILLELHLWFVSSFSLLSYVQFTHIFMNLED